MTLDFFMSIRMTQVMLRSFRKDSVAIQRSLLLSMGGIIVCIHVGVALIWNGIHDYK